MLGTALSLLFSACTGLFGGIYDDPEVTPPPTPPASDAKEGTIVIDATSWTDWYYVDLNNIEEPTPYPIPFPDTELIDPLPPGILPPANATGIYTYWFDVWNKGISVNEFRTFLPTDEQPAPEEWSFAVHRNNARTNGGAVYETQFTDIGQLDYSREELEQLPFTADEWTDNVVWADQSQMLNSLVGSQGIEINNVLSSWLRLDIPPMPPAFTHNKHVFILRLADGSYAALQLANYLSPTGAKCYLTINYKYPI